MDIHGNRFMLPELAKQFMLAGNARVTIKSVVTGKRFTFRIRQGQDPSVWFVGVLTGSDNDSSYTNMGFIKNGEYARSRRSIIGYSAPSHQAFDWTWRKLLADRLPESVEVWHEGRCGRCARPLTDPTSIERGFGPECINHV